MCQRSVKLTWLVVLFTTACTHPPMVEPLNGELELRVRSQRAVVGGGFEAHEEVRSFPPHRTALVVCDMWDRHWCRGAEARVAELAPRLNEVVARARARGVLVIHAPSTCMAFYAGTAARARAVMAPHAASPVPLSTAQRWGTAWCWPQPQREPDMPVDDSDMGCDCDVKCEIFDPWTRQIASIDILAQDAVTDSGQETFNLLNARGIDNVILTGVHLNMCVLGRPFGIRQLVTMGKDVVLMRDMTDTMYNSAMEPRVSHFAGTDLVVAHVERFWCPTTLSTDLTGQAPFTFAADPRR